MRLFGLALENQGYGQYNTPSSGELYQRFEKASFSLNGEPVSLRLGSKDVQAARMGYTEPTGSSECTMDSKTFQYLLHGILGNYTFTSGTKNTHEFYSGENSKLPSFNGDFIFDIARKKVVGLQADEMKIDVKNDLITVGMEWIYQNERSVVLKNEEKTLADYEEEGLTIPNSVYANYNIPKGIPYIGYDGTFKLGTKNILGASNVPSFVINDCSINIKNNHNRDSARDVFHRTPTKKPICGDRDVEVQFSTTMDLTSYRLLVAAEYGQLFEEDELVEKSLLTPHACLFTTLPAELAFKTCEDTEEYVTFKFPKCILQADALEVSGTDQINITFTLTPMGGDSVTLLDGKTKVNTSVYAVVCNDQDEIGYHTKGHENPASVNSTMNLSANLVSEGLKNTSNIKEELGTIEDTSSEEPDEETE